MCLVMNTLVKAPQLAGQRFTFGAQNGHVLELGLGQVHTLPGPLYDLLWNLPRGLNNVTPLMTTHSFLLSPILRPFVDVPWPSTSCPSPCPNG